MPDHIEKLEIKHRSEELRVVSKNLEKNHLDAAVTRVAEIPFDSRNKYLAALYHRFTKESAIYVKGAFEVLIAKCEYYEENGEKKKLTAEKRKWFEEKEKDMAANGFRVLASAYYQVNEFTEKLEPKDLRELVLVGLIALSDPIRPEVKQSIISIGQAGIRSGGGGFAQRHNDRPSRKRKDHACQKNSQHHSGYDSGRSHRNHPYTLKLRSGGSSGSWASH